jgi:hypothetical protein
VQKRAVGCAEDPVRGRGFFVGEGEIKIGRGNGKQAIVGVVNGEGECWKREPTALRVTDEGAARAAAPVRTNG